MTCARPNLIDSPRSPEGERLAQGRLLTPTPGIVHPGCGCVPQQITGLNWEAKAGLLLLLFVFLFLFLCLSFPSSSSWQFLRPAWASTRPAWYRRCWRSRWILPEPQRWTLQPRQFLGPVLQHLLQLGPPHLLPPERHFAERWFRRPEPPPRVRKPVCLQMIRVSASSSARLRPVPPRVAAPLPRWQRARPLRFLA